MLSFLLQIAYNIVHTAALTFKIELSSILFRIKRPHDKCRKLLAMIKYYKETNDNSIFYYLNVGIFFE